jgi:hypothetical protein
MVPSYRISPHVHVIENHLSPGAIQLGFFHQLTGEMVVPNSIVQDFLLKAESGNQTPLGEDDLAQLTRDSAQVRQLIRKEFLIPEDYDPLNSFVEQYVVRPIQNPAVAYAAGAAWFVARASMAHYVFSPERGELAAIIEEKLTPIVAEVFRLADGTKTLREIFESLGKATGTNLLEEREFRDALDFLTCPERQLIKFTPQVADLEDPYKPCNTVPRSLYRISRTDPNSDRDASESVADFHRHGIEDAGWEFDLIEPTINHSFRFPTEALGGLDYGGRFCVATLRPEVLPLLGNSEPLQILEVGGGTGTFAKSFLERAHSFEMANFNGAKLNYQILELSPALIQNQRERLASLVPTVEHFQQDATEFNIPGRRRRHSRTFRALSNCTTWLRI